jgi:hypothetical protein
MRFMLLRIFIACLGAITVTVGMLLAMDAVTNVFRDRDLQRYFRITDILPKADPGRPERPEAVARPPDAPTAESPAIYSTPPLQAPADVQPEIEPPVVLAPEIDAGETPSAGGD